MSSARGWNTNTASLTPARRSTAGVASRRTSTGSPPSAPSVTSRWRRHSSRGSGQSVRRWHPRLSVRVAAAATIARATVARLVDSKAARVASTPVAAVAITASRAAAAASSDSASRSTPTWRDIAARTAVRWEASIRAAAGSGPSVAAAARSGSSQARSRPRRVPATIPSVRLFDASRLAPCTPVRDTSPTA